MKKTEKIIAAILTMTVGVLLIAMKDNFIGVLTSLIGVGFILFGIADVIGKSIPPAVVKMVGGLILILCGWLVVEAVLYVLSAIALVCGILFLYDQIKRKVCGETWWQTALIFTPSALCVAIGLLLLFHKTFNLTFIFICCGIFAMIEGGVFLFNAFLEEE